ncbi:MAG: VCBS repeat-containing protein [Lentisphaerae bacterium]|nr:VCBS repeat-containing protein [Lentisphaerota bacterium]
MTGRDSSVSGDAHSGVGPSTKLRAGAPRLQRLNVLSPAPPQRYVAPGFSRENAENSSFSLQPSAFSSWQLLATATGTAYNDTTPVFGAGYAYRVRAVSPASTGEFSQAVTGWLAPETIPDLRAGRGLHTHQVRVSWDALEGATDYELQRSATEDFASPELLRVLAGTQYEDITAVPGQRYYYRVKARRGVLYWYSRSGSGWRKLSPPAGVTASQGDMPVGIRVSWPAAEGADYYEVWTHAENDVFHATPKAQLTGLEWVDESATLGAQRYYWVRSRSAVDVSDYSFAALGRAALTCRLGGPGYLPLKGDFDGDGLADPAVYDAATGTWRVLMSSADYAEVSVGGWGGPAWLPVAADYDGDGLTDPAVYLESEGRWMVWLSGSGYAPAQVAGWGGTGWQPGAPVPADYDGTGQADPAVYREAAGVWQVWLSGAGYERTAVEGWGGAGWLPVSGDYDGDGKDDPAAYHAASGRWRVWLSDRGYRPVTYDFGGPDYTGLALDIYGAGICIPVIYNPTDGIWWIRE